jgi:hypothetical protein
MGISFIADFWNLSWEVNGKCPWDLPRPRVMSSVQILTMRYLRFKWSFQGRTDDKALNDIGRGVKWA